MSFDNKYFINLINDFIIFYYKQFNLTNLPRYIAVDGSVIQLLHSLNTSFKSNKIKTYTTGYISNLYDIDNQVPIAFELFQSSDERANLIKQFKYLNKNDILIADRGYYSIDIINKLISLEIKFVFRVKKNNIFIIENIKNDKDILDENLDKSIKYNFKDKIYDFRILKYSNVEKINIKHDINTLKQSININNIKINKINIELTELTNKFNITKTLNKKMNLIRKTKKTKNKKNKKKLIKNRKRKKELKNLISKNKILKLNLIDDNVKNMKLINEIINYEQSSYFILTNLNINNQEIKQIYKKRWGVETCFRHSKDKLKILFIFKILYTHLLVK
jgi:hypothetical protein